MRSLLKRSNNPSPLPEPTSIEPPPQNDFEANLYACQNEAESALLNALQAGNMPADQCEAARVTFWVEADLIRHRLVEEYAHAPRPLTQWEKDTTFAWWQREVATLRQDAETTAANRQQVGVKATTRLGAWLRVARQQQERQQAQAQQFRMPGTGSHRQRLADLGIHPESKDGQEYIRQWQEQESGRPGAIVVPPVGTDRAAAQQAAMRARQALEDAQQEAQQEAIERTLAHAQREARLATAAREAEQRHPPHPIWTRPDTETATAEEAADEAAFNEALVQAEGANQPAAQPPASWAQEATTDEP